MQNFLIDTEVALRIEKLVKNKPFEALTFNEALIRLLDLLEQKGHGKQNTPIPKKEKSKDKARRLRREWVAKIPELSGKCSFNTWAAICKHLGLDPKSSSARRVLRIWVSENKPDWPPVPGAIERT